MLEITMISIGFFIGMILLLVGIYLDPVRFYNHILKEWIEIRSGDILGEHVEGNEENTEDVSYPEIFD